MRLVLLSDTHENNLNTKWVIPQGDVLIHAGDATARGRIESLAKFGRELQEHPHRFKIFVPGNHDRLFADQTKLAVSILATHGIITLIDESIVLPGGLHIYGTPWIQEDPGLFPRDFATFMTLDAKEHFAKIPEYVDILITHQPPYGVLSQTLDGEDIGSTQLATELTYRIHPRLHVFGHVHEQGGWKYVNDQATPLFVNAALCGPRNQPATPPIVIDFDEYGATVVEE